MGSRKHKQLTFQDYLALYHDGLADNLTFSQLQQVLFIHGLQKRSFSYKEAMVDAVSSLDLIPATRSTINSDIAQLRCDSAKSPVYLEEVKQNMHDIGWQECPIGSIVVMPDVSTSSPTSQKKGRKRTNKNGATKDAKELKSEVKKTIHVLATSLKDVDNCSWANYGSQMIKGFTARRTYYRCKNKLGCQVMKHVDQDPTDPSMCIVTYKGEHNHTIP